MFGQVVGGYSDVVTGSTVSRLVENIEINLQAFHYSPTVHTYVYGPLLDPISGTLAALGISFALGHVAERPWRLLLIWFAVAIVMTGLLSPYPHVAVTRLSFALPPLALMAGLLVGNLYSLGTVPVPGSARPAKEAAFSAALIVLLPLVLALNLWQFWHITPSVQPHTREALALGVFRSDICEEDAERTVFVGRAAGDGTLMQQLFASFYPDGPAHRFAGPGELQSGDGFNSPPPRCVVFLDNGTPETRELQESLQHQYPDGHIEVVVNPSKTTSVEIFVRD